MIQSHTSKFLFTSLCILVACSGEKEKTQPAEVEVPVVTVQQRNVPIYREFVGQAYGESDIEIRSRVDGWITGMPFTEGGEVKKGQLLYTIDALPYQTEVDRAKGELAAAQADFANADANLKRIRPLAQINAVSQRELDAAQANYDATKSIVEAQKANVANQQIELGYTRVLSPINGIIGISNVREGDYVNSFNNGLLNTVSQIDKVRVRFPVSEIDVLKITRDNIDRKDKKTAVAAELILVDGSIYEHKGSVNFADRQIDPETGTLTIETKFPNPEGLLRPGQFVRVRVMYEERQNALIIPQRAVVESQGIYRVFTVKDNKVVAKVVQAGLQVGNEWIIDSGLESTDQVAILGNIFIQPNSTIKPVKAEWKPSDKNAEAN
ncbi:MAG: efflux RND transporter periplasmic adaptor subunit [Flammeovirgaceae bacterium]|nr:efflux RND transporter periplasmic adaptor subunit [Flammeovirgaceae bacterium]